MNVKYIDAHCHIQFEQYAEDDIELIERMREDGVAGIVVGVDYESSKKAIALAGKYEHLFASVGTHPNNMLDVRRPTSDVGRRTSNIRGLANNSKVVAIGECGL
ncbi:TatD family hydrolase, partial [Candidatus Kaiserbacteria bacterium]|nr:TatD family hydrolase [Candidatus Kaiserbacteria bacterium]